MSRLDEVGSFIVAPLENELLDPPESVLMEAEDIIHGDRNQDYGHPLDNHGRTAGFWSTYLGIDLTPEQVCVMNILQKLSRSMNRMTRDTLVDVCGYSGNIQMIEEERAARGLKP